MSRGAGSSECRRCRGADENPPCDVHAGTLIMRAPILALLLMALASSRQALAAETVSALWAS